MIPSIGGFSPLPLGIMIPFMEAQSAAFAYAFGLNYQASKRKIASLSNEEFNVLTPEKLQEMSAAHTRVHLDGFVKAIPHTHEMQKHIIDEMVRLEYEKLKVLPNLIANIPKSLTWLFGISPDEFAAGQRQAGTIDPNLDPNKFNPPTTTPTDEPPSPRTHVVGSSAGVSSFISPQEPPAPKPRRPSISSAEKTQLNNFIADGVKQLKVYYDLLARYTKNLSSGNTSQRSIARTKIANYRRAIVALQTAIQKAQEKLR